MDGETDGRPLLFTASNPHDSVSATVTFGGHLVGVALAPRVVEMTEHELAEEIVVIAALARQQSMAAQHVVIAGYMAELGHDVVATRNLLEHQVGLPSPESVLAARAALFADRYALAD
ncbi:hypothetical protein AB0K11_23395 [Mycobacterium sp. NPDC050551]|uniref:hypothetical protein n=1 Tax=Mycobacterium sp. NPDC050551 TaxID=3155407 RepID=UPI00343450BF